ncbi:MAG TPA: GTPase HflX [Ktedonobacterales bacterium]|nr:GTPase HflX [Ktedonobacterales bacterium]
MPPSRPMGPPALGRPKEDTFTAKNGRLLTTSPAAPLERAFLAAVEKANGDVLWGVEDSVSELGSLARTAGAEIVGSMIQRLRSPDPTTYMGKGRADELAQLHEDPGYDLLILDDELAPAQQRNLEDITGARVIDRTALILDIFAQHARTREGQLQVELAQLEYRLPRLTGRGRAMSRVGGGSRGATGGTGGAIGVRGPGETKLEIDRRRIRTRIAELKRELEAVRQQRGILRRQRSAKAIPVVAIVGYTNAGKSTLFNTLTSAGVIAENKLFATLDPTTRHVTLPTHQEALMTDTVGFIQKLPTSLVAAFRATLEEVVEADILLEVVDVTHENAIEQSETVNAVLAELGAADKPRVTALNKIDLLPDPAAVDTALWPNAVPVSALTGQGIPDLLRRVGEVIAAQLVPVRVLVPFERGDLVEVFHRRGHVTEERHELDGTLLVGSLPPALLGVFAQFRAPARPAPRRSRGAPGSAHAEPERAGQVGGK